MFGIGKDSYKNFFDRTAALLATAAFDGRLGRVNPAWEEQLGLSPASLAGKSFLDLVHPEDRAAAETTWGKVRDGERTARFDARLRCADGAYKWFNTRLSADRESGTVNLVSAEISARKLTEEALRNSESALRRLVDHAPVPMALQTPDGKNEYLNAKYTEVFGYSIQDIPDKETWMQKSFPDPERRARMRAEFLAAFEKALPGGGEIAPVDCTLTCKDGSARETTIRGVQAGGKVLALFIDRAESAKTMAALRESEAHLRHAMDNAPMGLGIISAQGKLEYENSKLFRILGYGLGEIPDLATWVEKTAPDAARRAEHAARIQEGFSRLQAEGAEADAGEFLLRAKDGTLKSVLIRGAMSGGKITVMFDDVSERTAAARALRESEETLRKIIDNAPMAMAIVNIEGVIEYINRKAVEVFGYPHSDIPNMDRWWELAYPDPAYRKEVVETWMGRVYKAFENKTEIPGSEFRVTRKDGRVITCYIFGVIAAGKVFVMFDDITRRVETENTLRDSAANLRRVLEMAPVAIGLRDVATGDLDFVNEAFTSAFGYSVEDIRTFRDWVRKAMPDGPFAEEWKDNWEKLAAAIKANDGTFPTGEYKISCKDGSVKTVILRGVVTPDNKVLGIFEDMTARELMVRNLRESEENLRKLLNAAPVPIGIHARDGRIEYLNTKFTATFGYEVADVPDKEAWALKVAPDAAYRAGLMSRWSSAVLDAAASGKELKVEDFNLTCKSGTVKTVSISGIVLGDKVLAVFHDRTEQLAAEKALRDSERTLRQILEQAPLAIAIQNFDNTFSFLNRKFFDYFGYTFEEIPDLQSWARRAYPDEAYRQKLVSWQPQTIQRALATNGEMEPIEVLVTCKDGTRKNVMVTGIVTPDKKIVSLLEDITDRVRAADAIRQSEATLRRILEQAPICIGVHTLDGRVEFLNSKFRQMFGYTLEDLPDLDVWARKAYPDAAYRKQLMDTWKEGTEKSVKTGREMDGMTVRVVCKDGSVKTALLNGVVTADGKVLAVFDDITVRTETERALRESESLYRALIETTRTGYVVIDGQGKVRDANKEYVRLTGHSDLKQIMGRNVLEWSATHNQKEAREAIDIVVRDGRLENYELDYVDKAGKITRVEINATVVTRDGVPQILGLIRDITARSKTEAHLRDSESLYRALVETTRTGYVVIDPEGRVTDANREYVRLTGHSDLKEIVGRRVTEWTAPDLMEENAAAVVRCARDGHIFNFETDYIDGKGRRTPIEINATVVRRGGTSRIHTLCRDITDRRRQEAELKALNQGLEKRVGERTAELSAANMELTMEIAQRIDAERAREKLQQELLQSQKMEVVGRLAGGIAHDFNNILVAISGYAEFLLKNAPDGSAAREDLNEILRETERGALLTRQLVTISRRQPLQLKVMNINAVVEDTCRMLKRLVGANVHLEPALAPDLAPIKADPGQVAQIILNLVINARDAMPDGGRISLATANEEVTAVPAGLPLPPAPGSYAVLTVTDTGSGIAPEIAAKIFEPFFTTKPEGKGTGLGLSTVYGIIQQAQGGLLLKSEPGKGASFKLYFPRTAEKA